MNVVTDVIFCNSLAGEECYPKCEIEQLSEGSQVCSSVTCVTIALWM